MSQDFDAIIVGSGASGGWAAKELCEAGFKVLVLERGAPMEHGSGYVTEFLDPWERPYESSAAKSGLTGNPLFWADPKDTPYQSAKSGKPFAWSRPGCVGGKSLTWGRQVYRWSDIDFEANKRDGHGVDWPIRYADIAPWYSRVERFIGVSGTKENLPQLPDSEFLPGMEMNVAEKFVKKGLENAYSDRKLIIGRVANITQGKPEQNRAACQFRKQCWTGCSFGAYYSSVGVSLPQAQKTNNLTIRPYAIVEGLDYDAKKARVTGVRVIDAQTKQRMVFHSRIVFLCASTIASTQILMNSRSQAAPLGLGGKSGALGRHLMDHTWGTRIRGRVPVGQGRITRGRRANGVYIPRFRNIALQQQSSHDFVRGYNFQGMGRHEGWPERAANTPGFGAEFKRNVQTPGAWHFTLYGFAECLPYKENTIQLLDSQQDPYGIPQVRLNAKFRNNEYKLVADMIREGEAMLKTAGLKNITSYMGPMQPGRAIHEMGTARMGHDPSTSVLNKWNQVHEAPNVFVTDGACMTSSGTVNPTLTFLALTARACDYAVGQLKNGTL